jgi:hypothetical protein
VYWATADLLDLEVDLLFFDTTSTYFETEHADVVPVTVDGDGASAEVTTGFRTYGHSNECHSQCVSSHRGVANSPT